MSEWLGMPTRLRTSPVRALVDAWQKLMQLGPSTNPEGRHTHIVTFADDYSIYYNKLESGQRSPTIDTLIAAAQGGSWDAAISLWTWFIDRAVESAEDRIKDNDVSKTLELARSMKGEDRFNLCRLLYEHLETQLGNNRASILYPKQNTTRTESTESMAIVSDESATVFTIEQISGDIERGVFDGIQDIPEDQLSESEDKSQAIWDALARNVKGSAERVWRDMFLNLQELPQRMTLRKVARISHLLMLLWLEVVLYQDRSLYNFDPRIIEGGRSADTESTRGGIRNHIKEYQSVIRRWDKELAGAMKMIDAKSGSKRKKASLRSHHLESQQFRRLIRQFSDPSPEELGWDSQVVEAEAELRYQLRDKVRHEKLADGHRFAALGLFILKITTGYGTRPIFFARTVLVLLLSDATLFFLNDLLHTRLDPYGAYCTVSQPQIHQWTDLLTAIPTAVLHYLYIATTTMTTLGSDSTLAPHCGGWPTQVLLALSTATGYFMLGLLGALLYTQLTQRD